ncbi:hypothetical protein FEZ48_02435 [Marinilactibacillus psychrotolerans]|uniref:YdbS-like PH domain-containing protein n=2 Tax=Marinilactibacillus psychrotolerans TaxID=191770 RepID=A0A5R9C778_9LACT|nr:hypothetical protein FEZ48_02435 [Marinilactibacillus psychrotolerans]
MLSSYLSGLKTEVLIDMNIQKVDDKVIKFWQVKALIDSVITILVFSVILGAVYFFTDTTIPIWIFIIALIILLISSLFSIFLFPILKGKYFGYSFYEDRIIIKKGVWFRKQETIPMIRIQNIESNIGPIAKKFNLTSLRVTTASKSHKLPELNTHEALELQNWVQQIIQKTI